MKIKYQKVIGLTLTGEVVFAVPAEFAMVIMPSLMEKAKARHMARKAERETSTWKLSM